MKQSNILEPNTGHERSRKLFKGYLSILTVLALGLGSVLSAGCLAAPAVLLTSAAVTATALVAEGEKTIQSPQMEGSYIVRSETDSNSGPPLRQCAPNTTLSEEDRNG
jgi:hypothetical protein